jgi:hypothetical protein
VTSDIDLDVINAHYATYLRVHAQSRAFRCCSAHECADDIPDLLAEIQRLTLELDQARGDA